jgi:hypothetical protein
MKRIAICLVLMLSLMIPITTPANASEKCLANFADTEWINGTPSGVKSLIGFDLVEKIQTNGFPTGYLTTFRSVDPYYLLGDFKIETTYTYLGKNCETRVVKAFENRNGPNSKFQADLLVTYIEKGEFSFGGSRGLTKEYANSNFREVEFRKKSVAAFQNYFALNSIPISKYQSILPGEPGNGFQIGKLLSKIATEANDSSFVNELLNSNNENGLVLPDGTWYISFPDKCASSKIQLGAINRVFAMQLPSPRRSTPIGILDFNFNTKNKCIGELRIGGVSEKVSDVAFEFKPMATNKSAIKCIKGKLSKKIAGDNPKCPAGYKKA